MKMWNMRHICLTAAGAHRFNRRTHIHTCSEFLSHSGEKYWLHTFTKLHKLSSYRCIGPRVGGSLWAAIIPGPCQENRMQEAKRWCRVKLTNHPVWPSEGCNFDLFGAHPVAIKPARLDIYHKPFFLQVLLARRFLFYCFSLTSVITMCTHPAWPHNTKNNSPLKTAFWRNSFWQIHCTGKSINYSGQVFYCYTLPLT